MSEALSALSTASREYWSTHTDGLHRHSEEFWYAKYADELLAMLPLGGVLVDVGCGAAQITTYLAPRFRQIFAFDFSDSMLAAASARVELLGMETVSVLKGTAQAFPTTLPKADVVLSYGVLQYLTLDEFRSHLLECRKILNGDGVVCASLVPNMAQRSVYYHERLAPVPVGPTRRLRSSLQLTLRKLKAKLKGNLLWDSIGNWYSQEAFKTIAEEVGFKVEFRNCWYYEYRFHALLTLREA